MSTFEELDQFLMLWTGWAGLPFRGFRQRHRVVRISRQRHDIGNGPRRIRSVRHHRMDFGAIATVIPVPSDAAETFVQRQKPRSRSPLAVPEVPKFPKVAQISEVPELPELWQSGHF